MNAATAQEMVTHIRTVQWKSNYIIVLHGGFCGGDAHRTGGGGTPRNVEMSSCTTPYQERAGPGLGSKCNVVALPPQLVFCKVNVIW